VSTQVRLSVHQPCSLAQTLRLDQDGMILIRYNFNTSQCCQKCLQKIKFCVAAPYSLVRRYTHFEGTCCLNCHVSLLLCIKGRNFNFKSWYPFTRLCSVTAQNSTSEITAVYIYYIEICICVMLSYRALTRWADVS
jgi:hypothetical protein